MEETKKYYGASRLYNGNNNFYDNINNCINSIGLKDISCVVVSYYPRSESDLIEELDRSNSCCLNNSKGDME